MSRKFKIDELEERIAPSSLSLGTILNGAAGVPGVASVTNTGSVNAGATVSNGAVGISAAATDCATANVLGLVNASLGVSANAAANVDAGSLGLGNLLGNLL